MVIPDSICYPRDAGQQYPYNPDGNREFLEDKPFLEPFSLIPGTGRGDQPDPVHHVRRQGAGPQSGAAGQAGDLDGGAHRRPASVLGVGTQPVARGLRHHRRPTGPAAGSGWTSRSRSCAGWRAGVLRVSGQELRLPPIKIAPVPTEPIPVLIGGHSDAALRRAARLGDGWMHGGGDPATCPACSPGLAELRRAEGTEARPFEIHVISRTPTPWTACACWKSKA